jgi:hypothetical protein
MTQVAVSKSVWLLKAWAEENRMGSVVMLKQTLNAPQHPRIIVYH